MNLSQSIDSYMLHKRSYGMSCREAKRILKAFLESIGDIFLWKITTERVQSFLDGSGASVQAWRSKHSVLRRFFEHWNWRGEMPFVMMPPLRPAVRRTVIPHIYTKPQIRSLLAATKFSQKRMRCKADAATLRMFILMLYATGAKHCELVNMRREDIAFKQSQLIFRGTGHKPPRSIPIGLDLKRELKAYLTCNNRRPPRRGETIFLSKSGEPLCRENFTSCFQRARKIAGLTREREVANSPQMQHFRPTFAVHRITSWIKSGASLNRLLPALSTYMGYASLEQANDYLSLTPERFKKELQKLSPKRGHKRWRDDSELMRFLHSL